MESAERYQRPALPEAGGLVSQPYRRVLQHTLAPTAGVVKASHRRHCRNSCSYWSACQHFSGYASRNHVHGPSLQTVSFLQTKPWHYESSAIDSTMQEELHLLPSPIHHSPGQSRVWQSDPSEQRGKRLLYLQYPWPLCGFPPPGTQLGEFLLTSPCRPCSVPGSGECPTEVRVSRAYFFHIGNVQCGKQALDHFICRFPVLFI